MTSSISIPFWEGCERGELLLQMCSSCGVHQSYPRPVCASCHSDELVWDRVLGRGIIHSYTVVHRAPRPDFEQKIPYVLVLIELEEGPRIMSNILNANPGSVRIGLAVEVVFVRDSSGRNLPYFQPTNQ